MSYANVNGLYYEEHGSGEPLVMLHGGIGASETLAPIVPALAAGRRVILVDLQGHGHTADVDRPLRPESLADDIAALTEHLGLEQVDLFGYSLGGAVALRTAIQHPGRVRRLVLVVDRASGATGTHPEVLAAIDQMTAAAAELMKAVAAVRALLAGRAAAGGLARADRQDRRSCCKVDYDWTDEVGAVHGADAARLRRPRLDPPGPRRRVLRPARRRAARPGLGRVGAWRRSSRCCPAATHYDVLGSPLLVPAVEGFLR